MKPQIITPDLNHGAHNRDLAAAQARLQRGHTYRDLSTVCITPTRGGRSLAPRAVSSWLGLIKPMNQKFLGPLFVVGDEVGEAYCNAVDMILANPELRTWRYLLTLEDDNLPPPDGLLKLYESIETRVQGRPFDVIGGLYWTKGEGGQPMIYGDPADMPLNFRPQIPRPDTVQPCHGLGMGFTLFRLSIFRDGRLPRPWFKTQQEYQPGQGTRVYTQDLYFFERAGRAGYRVACDTRVKVGHYDPETDLVW